jgi:hypothetical protein
MKRVVMLVVGILAFSAAAMAQMGRGGMGQRGAEQPAADQPESIANPLLALPAGLRADAGVVKWKPDFTYDTLKESKNGLVCWDRSGFPRQAPFSMLCSATENLPREAQDLKAEAESQGDRAKSEAILNEEEKAGTRVKPLYGSFWYHFAGPDKEHARMHETIAMPGATAQSTGLPDKRSNNSIWLMNAGTTTAHLMLPGE